MLPALFDKLKRKRPTATYLILRYDIQSPFCKGVHAVEQSVHNTTLRQFCNYLFNRNSLHSRLMRFLPQ